MVVARQDAAATCWPRPLPGMRPSFHVRCVNSPKVHKRSLLRASTSGQTLRPRFKSARGPGGPFASHTGARRFQATAVESKTSFYEDLGVAPTASINEIKKRYYQLSKQHHPDTAGPDYDEAAFHRIQIAYETLSDPSKKATYDRARAAPSESSPGYTQTSKTRKRRHHAAYGHNAPPINVGFTPRVSWDPEFRKFFDDLSQKMKAHGLNIETLTYTNTTRAPPPELLRELMNGDLLGAYLKKRREQGKDPLSDIFLAHQGRHPAGMQWLRSRMSMLEHDEARRDTAREAGGVWERGSVKRPNATRRPAYSTAYEDAMAGAAYSTGSSSGFGGAHEPQKREYTRGHQLDPRFESDRMQMVAQEKRLVKAVFAVASLGVVAGLGHTFGLW